MHLSNFSPQSSFGSDVAIGLALPPLTYAVFKLNVTFQLCASLQVPDTVYPLVVASYEIPHLKPYDFAHESKVSWLRILILENFLSFLLAGMVLLKNESVVLQVFSL